MNKESDYEDHIHDSYKEKTVQIINDESTYDIFQDQKYDPIFVALREGPLTVKDLEKKYNQIVLEKISRMDLSKNDFKILKEKMERKDKTLYKYLNVLEKNLLIVPAGKRFVKGKTAAETLYGRTAKLFFLSLDVKRETFMEEMLNAIPILTKILSLRESKSDVSNECLMKIIEKILNYIQDEREEIFEKYIEQLGEISDQVNYTNLKYTFFILDYILLLLENKGLTEELQRCMKS